MKICLIVERHIERVKPEAFLGHKNRMIRVRLKKVDVFGHTEGKEEIAWDQSRATSRVKDEKPFLTCGSVREVQETRLGFLFDREVGYDHHSK